MFTPVKVTKSQRHNTMLKFISSSHRCFGISTDQLCSELSLNIPYFMHRKKYHATYLLKNGKSQNATNSNMCTLNQKSIIPETVSRCCSNILNYELKSSAAIKMDPTVTTSNERPALDHASCGGTFQISTEQIAHHFTDSLSDDNVSTRHYCSRNSQPRPNFRMWEPVNNSFGPQGDTFKFKILSYNVLAQYLLEGHPYLYRKCATHCLKWEFRSLLLLDEICRLSPDILCLQEVQCSHIPTFYKKLEEFGYTGVFKQKTGLRQDGCAIYFKSSVFNMKDYISVEFYQPDLPILNRDNIGIILKLIPRNMPEAPFIVATTHLLFNPNRTDVRLAQIQVFLAEIDRFAYSAKKGKGHLPIILTGDLNSTPDSAVIHLLSYGNISAHLYRDGSDWKKIGVTDNCQHLAVYLSRLKGNTKRIEPSKLKIYNSDYRMNDTPRVNKYADGNNDLFNSAVLGHSLNLKSVYNHVKYDGQTEATTFQNEWVTVDYIYFSCQSGLNLLERLYLPTARECEALQILPNNEYGSDHLALGAVFELNTVKSLL